MYARGDISGSHLGAQYMQDTPTSSPGPRFSSCYNTSSWSRASLLKSGRVGEAPERDSSGTAPAAQVLSTCRPADASYVLTYLMGRHRITILGHACSPREDRETQSSPRQPTLGRRDQTGPDPQEAARRLPATLPDRP